jgi:zinc/manganese transport system substrate-binding protein
MMFCQKEELVMKMHCALAVIAALAQAAIGANAVQAEPSVKAVATFSILGDMVGRVGGDRVSVATLVGPDGDAHVYEPTPADAKAVSEAGVVFVNGLGFEGWLDRLTKSAAYKGPVVVASKGIKARAMEEEDHDDDHGKEEHGHHHHHHEGKDPHAWQSLKNGLAYVKNIADGLCKADSAGCDVYRKNADAYSAEITALDKQVREDLGKIAKAKRKVITSHDAFGYFGAAYGIEFLAPQGVSTEAEASAADVAKLIRQIRKEKVTALFVENISDARLIEQIGRETSVKPGGALYSDALSGKDGPAATYLDMFRHNVGLLTQSMAGS